MDLKFYYNRINNKIIFSVIILIIILQLSCSDIIDSTNDHIKQRIELNLSKDDSLSPVKLEPIDLGAITKPRDRYYNMILTNSSKLDTIFINNIKTDASTGITIIPLIPYPIVLLPNKTNESSQFLVYLQTYNITAGNYTYNIYLNESSSKYFSVNVKVLP